MPHTAPSPKRTPLRAWRNVKADFDALNEWEALQVEFQVNTTMTPLVSSTSKCMLHQSSPDLPVFLTGTSQCPRTEKWQNEQVQIQDNSEASVNIAASTVAALPGPNS